MRIETVPGAARSGRRGFGAWRAVMVVGYAVLGAHASAHVEVDAARGPSESGPAGVTLERQAERYVALALALGRRFPREVDAYFGPRSLDDRATRSSPTLQQLQDPTQRLLEELRLTSNTSPRRSELLQRVTTFDALLNAIGNPGKSTFDEEARLLYDIEPAPTDPASWSRARRELGRLLPGSGSLADRVDRFRRRFIIPVGSRAEVFGRAMMECRARTLAKWQLPREETLDVTFSRDVQSAWHRYEGHYHSTLKVNPEAVAFIGSAIDVACHEGYPGHHTQFVLMDLEGGPTGPDVEKTVILLRSPISLLREGAADYGVELVFPPAERLIFERDVLFPMAGLDASAAAKYAMVHRLIRELGPSVVPILRAYRDHRLAADAAGKELQESALVSSPGPLLAFVDQLGPFVLGYTVVHDQVHQYIDNRSKVSGEDPWSILRHIVAREDLGPLGVENIRRN